MISFVIIACNLHSEPNAKKDTSVVQETIEIPVPIDQRHQFDDCQQDKPPILALHGFLAAGDTYLSMENFFIQKGWCRGAFRVLDWDSLSQERLDVIDAINDEIEDMKSLYQTEQIILIGHSAGGGLSLDYLDNSMHHDTIAAYIHLASFPIATPPTIPMLNIYSSADKVVAESTEISSNDEDIDHVQNVDMNILDHFEVATHSDVFVHIQDFLEETLAIAMDDRAPHSEMEIYGKSVYFGSNEIIRQADIYVYELQDAERTTNTPLFVTQSNQFGLFGPIPVNTETTYEICLKKSNEPTICHLFPYFDVSSSILRLRGVPEEGLAASLLSSIPLENTSSVRFVTFSSQQALIYGRDSLLLEGEELITEERATPEDSLIAIFHYDANSDEISQGDVPLFQAFPFLSGLDQYFSTTISEPLHLSFQDVDILIPRREHEVMLVQLP